MTGPRSYRRRLLVVGGLVPALIALTGAAVALSWVPRLPREVAVHWTGSGADGFGSPLLVPVVLIAITAVFSAIVLTALWKPGDGPRGNGRFLLAVSGWLPTFLSLALVGSLAPQLDGSDPAAAPFPLVPLLLGFVGGVVVGAAIWMVAPTPPPFDRVQEQPEEVDLAEGVRALWIDTASAPRALTTVLGAGAVVLLIVAAATTFAAGLPGVALFAAPVVLGLACLTLTWRVRIDQFGFVTRPAIGFPAVRIPIEHIRDASVVQVSPVNDFGGWGLRFTRYGTGVILRTGSALRLEQTGGSFTITLDDAPRAAGLVRALIAQRKAAID